MSTEIIHTFAVLGITIFLFVKEWLCVDVVALSGKDAPEFQQIQIFYS